MSVWFKESRLTATGKGAAALVLVFGLGTVSGLAPALPARADSGLPANTLAEKLPSFAPIVDKVLPAVVNISVVQKMGGDANDGEEDEEQDDQGGQAPPGLQGPGTPFDEMLRRFFEQQHQGRHGGGAPGQKVTALGSGFIIDPAGFIVTNNHVVGDADKVTVIFQDGSKKPAKIIGKDQKTDLALLQVDAGHPLPYVKFGDSDKAKVGDWVVAVGNPFGLEGTVTKGIISARGRPVEESGYVDFLQVDASINKGNSGGPTFDLNGDVIGINTAIFSPNGGSVGIGFAIPSNTARPVIEALKTTGHIDRGFLGVQIQEVTPDIASSLGLDPDHPTGALVAAVTDGSPAAKAGIKVGDVVEKFDGKIVEKMRDLPRLVGETGIGKKVDVGILRAGQHLTVQAAVGQLDETKVAANGPIDDSKPNKMTAMGLYLQPLNPDIRKRLNVPKEIQGVLVSRVKEGSPAAEQGIEAGDVIVQVNGEAVANPDEVGDKVKAANPTETKSVLLLVNRHGQNRFVALKPNSDKKG
jgi:serine protease Do